MSAVHAHGIFGINLNHANSTVIVWPKSERLIMVIPRESVFIFLVQNNKADKKGTE